MANCFDLLDKKTATLVKKDAIKLAQDHGGLNGAYYFNADQEIAKLKATKAQILAEAKKETPKPAEKPIEPENKVYSLADYSAFFDEVDQGNVTAEQYKEEFEKVVDNDEAIKAELNLLTKSVLLGRYPYATMHSKNDKKDAVVDDVYQSFLGRFTLGESVSYEISTTESYSKSRNNAIRSMVYKKTDDDLNKYAEGIKKSKSENEAFKAEVEKGMENPQTLDDYTRVLRSYIKQGDTFKEAFSKLSPEQRETYDILFGETTRGDRKARADQQKTDVRATVTTASGDIIETKHTKTGEDLFVVKAADRVERETYNEWNTTAKRLGGWYSSFKGAGAVPGFQFKTKENAEAFLKYLGGDVTEAKEAVQARRDAYADDKSQSAAERLTEMADRLEEKADEELGRSRKANTAKRAMEAAGAIASAERSKALAVTMRNIAEAIGSGKTKFLDRVRQKVQVEYLHGLVNTTQYTVLRDKYSKSYNDYLNHQHDPATKETADSVKMPDYSLYRSELANLGRKLIETDGTKKYGQAILKEADDVTDVYLKFAKENLNQLMLFRFKDGSKATFKLKTAAERSIAASDFNGKAIVAPVAKGEYAIILSPSEAMKAGIWKGDDKLITISHTFGKDLVEKLGRVNRKAEKVKIPWQFENAYENRKRLAGMGIETPSELRAALREFIELSETPKQPDKIKEMERAMIGRRNDGLYFFPTPSAIGDSMVETADIQEGMSVLEPSAGMGHIAERIREAGVEPDVVELSNDRRELLEAKGFNVVDRDFMEFSPETGYDRILMNPPFSDRRDMAHVQHAYDLLKPGGRLVAIMGEGVFFGQDKKAVAFREWLEERGGTDEKLEEGTFKDPSLPVTTGVNARMIVVDKPEGVKFSKSPDKPSQSTASEITAMLPGYTKSMVKSGKLEAVQSVSDLPSYLQERGTALYHAAWHGSPHDHDKFDMGKVGTGEGAQAFGYGLYFTNSRKIADYYSQTLAGSNVQKVNDLAESIGISLGEDGFAARAIIAFGQQVKNGEINRGEAARKAGYQSIELRKLEPELLRKLIDTYVDTKFGGRIYQVELAPKPDEYLDWDKPLGDQSQLVKDIFKSSGLTKEYNSNLTDFATPMLTRGREKRGKNFHAYLEYKLGSDKAVSEYLHGLGIRGIRYKADGGTSKDYNYVIFSDDDVSITAKFSKLSGVEALYDTKNDKVYLVADMLNNGNLKAVLNHELFHRALQTDKATKAAYDKFNTTLKSRFDLASKGLASKEENSAYKRVIGSETPKENWIEEFSAYQITAFNTKPESLPAAVIKAIKEFIAAIRAALIRAGVPLSELTAADLNALAQYGAKVSAQPQTGQANAMASAKSDRFYSALKRAFIAAPDKIFGNGKQLALWVQGNAAKLGVKSDELYWSGLLDYLSIASSPISENSNSSTIKNLSDIAAINTKMFGDLITRNSGIIHSDSFIKIPSNVASAYSMSVKSMSANPQSLSDFRRFIANGGKGFSSLNIDSKRMVIAAMRFAIHDDKILNSIIKLVPVDVMDVIIGRKGSSNMLLHDPSMLKEIFTIDANSPVPVSSDMAFSAFESIPALHIAKAITSGLNIARLFIDDSITTLTSNFHNNEEYKNSRYAPHHNTKSTFNKVTRDDVLQYLDGNGVQVQEVVLGDDSKETEGFDDWKEKNYPNVEANDSIRRVYAAYKNRPFGGDTKYQQYTVPGGKNYRETLLTLPPNKDSTKSKWRVMRPNGSVYETFDSKSDAEEIISFSPPGYELRELPNQVDPGYKSSHWDQPNIIAHIRTDERTDSNGDNLLFLNEIQSDFGQDGKKKGFLKQYKKNDLEIIKKFLDDDNPNNYAYAIVEKGTDKEISDRFFSEGSAETKLRQIIENPYVANPNGVPPSPFVQDTKAWIALSLKHAISQALDSNINKVAIISGEQAADLYDLRKQVKSIEWSRNHDDTFDVQGNLNNGEFYTKRKLDHNGISEIYGKEIADKITSNDAEEGELRGIDLAVGGSGMKAFYDSIVPSVARDIAKRMGGEFTTVKIPVTESKGDSYDDIADEIANPKRVMMEQNAIIITPKMREKILSEGMPLFSKKAPEPNNDIRYSKASDIKDAAIDFVTGRDRGVIGLTDLDKMLATGKMPKEKTDMQAILDKAATMLVDSSRTFDVWTRKLPINAGKLIFAKDRAKRRTADFEKQALDKFLHPLAEIIGDIAKKFKMEYRAANELVGRWMTVRYAIEKNADFLRQDREALAKAKLDLSDKQAEDRQNLANGTIDAEPANSGLKSAVTKAQKQYDDRFKAINEQRLIDSTTEQLDAGLAGGYNDFTAKHYMDAIETKIGRATLDRASKHVYDMLKWKLSHDLKNGKVTQDMVNSWFNSPNYVPLTGDPNADEGDDSLFSHGSLNQQSDKKAIGRKGSFAINGIDAATEATQKSARYHGWVDFKDALTETYDELVDQGKANGLTEREAIREVSDKYGIDRTPESGITRPSDSGIIVRKNGKNWVYDINDTKAVDALRSVNREDIPSVLQPIAWFTRNYSRLVTQFMPGFGPINMIRDTLERSENIRTRALPGYESIDMNKVGRKALKTAADPRLIKKILGVMLEGTNLEGKVSVNNADPDIKVLREMIAEGGTSTVGAYLSSTSGDLAKQMKDSLKWSTKTMDIVSAYNNSFELVSSFSVYKALRDSGVDKKTAASGVLNLMNFSKHGTIVGPMKALWVFLNPTMQGGHQLIQTLSTKRGQARAAAYFIVGVALYAMLRAGDDDDEFGVNRMDELGNFVLERNIPIPMGGNDYVKAPVGFGLQQMMWSTAANTGKFLFGNQTAGETGVEMLKSWSRTLAPIAPSETSISAHPLIWATQTFTPQVIKPFVNVAMDVNTFGSPLTSKFEKEGVAHALQGKKTTAEEYKDIAKELSKMGFDLYPEQVREIMRGYMIGPMNEIVKATIENPNKAALGKDYTPQLLDRIVAKSDDKELKERLFYRELDKINAAAALESIDGELSEEDKRLADIAPIIKKLQNSSNGKLAAASKADKANQPGKAKLYRIEAEALRNKAMNQVLKQRKLLLGEQ